MEVGLEDLPVEVLLHIGGGLRNRPLLALFDGHDRLGEEGHSGKQRYQDKV